MSPVAAVLRGDSRPVGAEAKSPISRATAVLQGTDDSGSD